ncbi:MAG: acetate--CoA ligase family protein [Gammaproteobacteria bacterium]
MRDLSRLLRPKSIAVFGGVWAENVVLQCRRMQYGGEVWAVNPRRKTLGGVKCFRRAGELPRAPDAAFIGVNREAAAEIAGELAALGCGGAVCFASGFAESGAADLQERLINAAGKMPLLGPNCYGLVNFLDGAPLWPDQHGGARVKSGAALIGQSSNILINISSQKRALPVAYLAAAGNQAQTTMAGIARGMLEDDRVRAIGFYIEGIANAAEFAEMAARAEERGVLLAALKAGKCESSANAAASHTAALTGGAAASSAFLRKCNIAEARTLPELLETLKLLLRGKLGGRKIMSLSCSGGEAGHAADLSVGRRLRWLPPPAKQRRELARILGPLVHIANPLDYHTFIWHDFAALYKTYCAALRCGNDLTVLIYDFPRGDRCDTRDWNLPLSAFMRAAADTGARAAVAATLPENMPEDVAEKLQAAGIAPLCGLSETLDAAEHAAALGAGKIGKWRPLPPARFFRPRLMDEAAAKNLLQQNGVACPAGRRADTPKEAGAAAKKMAAKKRALRFAVKTLGAAHKTESGGVCLNVAAAEVQSAAAKMPNGGGGFLVEEMAENTAAELLVGARRDSVYGATLTVGAGGVCAELWNDSETIALPAAKREIAAAFRRLRIAPLLAGFRGGKKADMSAVANAAHAAARLLQSRPDIAEIEINPLLARESDAVAADAVITTGEQQ